MAIGGMLPIIGVGMSGAAIIAAGTYMQRRKRRKEEQMLAAAAMARAYAVRREEVTRPRGTYLYRPAIRHAAMRRLNHLRGLQFSINDLAPFIR